MRLNRAGEIDYYEELGVERNAAPEAIRDSFRALVRLLHPDQQTDENLKLIAEKQMRKVNRIYAVLSDPERRRRYDEMLDEEFVPPTIVFNPATNITAKALITRIVWIGLAMLGVALVIWIATDPPAGPVFGPETRSTSASNDHPAIPAKQTAAMAPSALTKPDEREAAAGAPDEINRLKAELRFARQERDEAKKELARLQTVQPTTERTAVTAGPAPAQPSSPLPSVAELAAPHLAPAPVRTGPQSLPVFKNLKLPGSDPHQFAGFWYFARTAQTPKNKNLYPPEFIEAVLTEANGVVHGKYRSRYQIVDRAISPDVNFEFSGSPSGGVITCQWIGQGGAKGQLVVHMADENNIKVDWTANEMGTVQGLASGTATLARRPD
jgi:hypothetical protein